MYGESDCTICEKERLYPQYARFILEVTKWNQGFNFNRWFLLIYRSIENGTGEGVVGGEGEVGILGAVLN